MGEPKTTVVEGCWAEEGAHAHHDGRCPYACPGCGCRLAGSLGLGPACSCPAGATQPDPFLRLAAAAIEGGDAAKASALIHVRLDDKQ